VRGDSLPPAGPGAIRIQRYPAGDGFLVATTGRGGGVSGGAYESLNLSFHTGDDEETVRENRRRVTRILDLDPATLTCGQQIHDSRIRVVTREDRGRGALGPDSFGDTDGLVTSVPETPLLAFGADCPGIALVDPVHRAVGVAHSGWRGTVGGIAGKLVQALVLAFGTRPRDLLGFVSPGIGSCCYEVGEEVLSRGEAVPDFGRHVEMRRGRPYLDLRGVIRAQLEREGLLTARLVASEACTRCCSQHYFSYRAQGSRTGSCAIIAMVR